MDVRSKANDEDSRTDKLTNERGSTKNLSGEEVDWRDTN